MPSRLPRVPSRVYWTRRLLVLGTVPALILAGFLVTRYGGALTAPTAATPSASPTGSMAPTATPTTKKKKKAKSAKNAALTPQGPCDPASLVVVPLVPESSVAESKVTVGLSFTTTADAACTFDVTSDTVVVRIVRGSTRVWSTQDCPAVVLDQQIVVGPHTPGIARLDWNGERSSAGCPDKAKYAGAGKYLIQAAAYGSDAGQMRFELTAAPTPTVTPTATATASKS